MIFAIVGPLFNTLILRAQDMFQRIHGGNTTKWVLVGGLLGGAGGFLWFIEPCCGGWRFRSVSHCRGGEFQRWPAGVYVFVRHHHGIMLLLRRTGWDPAQCWCWVAVLARRSVWRGGALPPYHLDAGRLRLRERALRGGLPARAADGIVLVLEMTRITSSFASDHYSSCAHD
ncbi:hypothetical protein ACNKHS_01030 [Shigella flexneri]